jgi:succinyl-CoA synthetase alpha subunit
MLLNEHDSKRLFAACGLPVPPGEAVSEASLESFSPPFPPPWFVKAQVLCGGRGKAGGIRRVDRSEDFAPTAREVLGMSINGNAVPLVRVEPGAAIAREFYLSLCVSRPRRALVLAVGREGGMDIESGGADNLLVQEIPLPEGIQAHHFRAAFFHLELGKEHFQPFCTLLRGLWEAVRGKLLLLAEVNPLVLTGAGEFLALDGKVEIDDNAVDLDAALEEYYRAEHHAPEETTARAAGLSFVKLGGYVGLMVNGAGLAMASMDLLNYSDLPAANFLDLGGGADQERMEAAFALLFGDPDVRMVFINLYGGILSCRKVALAMRAALGGRAPRKPIVARLSGNEAEEGLEILHDLNAPGLHLATSMGEAIVTLASLRPEGAPASPFKAPALEAQATAAPADFRAPSGGPVFNLDATSPILVQGITGREGRLHTELMLAYGANVVAGVTPFKGGQEVLGVPVYHCVAEARRVHDIAASIIFVPPAMAADAVREAASNAIPWAVCITEGIRQQEMLSTVREIASSPTRLIGPNTPGIIIPGQTKIGILPTDPFTPGNVAVLSRSGTLTYEVAARLSAAGIGQSVSIGVGGDPFIGSDFADLFDLLRDHEPTKAVVVLGEIGGRAEEDLALHLAATGFPKPVVAFIAGRTAPPGRRLGHAGAILETGGGMETKIAALREGGFTVCPDLGSISQAVARALGGGA